MIADCVTLWIGDSLGDVERACLRSVLRQGHRLAVYCYGEVARLPAGVEVRDASAILPEEAVFRHRSGSVAPFADRFRYELLRRGLGTWIDTDVYLLAPLDGDAPYLFGVEAPGVVNNAVLRLPPEAPALAALLRPFDDGWVPRWLPWRIYLRERARQLLGGNLDFAQLPWGSTGPSALSAVVCEFALTSKASPREIFYPVPWQRADWILDPSLKLEQMVTERTVAVHLWNECIKQFKDLPAPEGSFLSRLQAEGAAS